MATRENKTPSSQTDKKMEGAVTPEAVTAEAVTAEAVTAEAYDPGGSGKHDSEKTKKRHQINEILGLTISTARVQAHLKAYLSDPEIDGRLKELRSSLKDAKSNGDAQQESEIRKQLTCLSQEQIRVSSATPIVTAAAMDWGLQNCIEHSLFRPTLKMGRKMVESNHLTEDNPSQHPWWTLFHNLPTYMNWDGGQEEEIKKDQALTNKRAKELREARKKAKEAGGVVPEVKKEDKMDNEAVNTNFVTYIDNAFAAVKATSPEFKGLRVAHRTRAIMAELMREFIARVAVSAKIVVKQLLDVRTLGEKHVINIFRMWMADANRPDEEIQSLMSFIEEKLACYNKHLKTEEGRKWEEMSEDRKQEKNGKLQQQAQERLQKSLEANKLTIVRLEEKIKTTEGRIYEG